MTRWILSIAGLLLLVGIFVVYRGGAWNHAPIVNAPSNANSLVIPPAVEITASGVQSSPSNPVIETIIVEPVSMIETRPPVVGGALLGPLEEIETLPPLPVPSR